MPGVVLVEHRDAIAIIPLNLPKKRNALSSELYPELLRVLDELIGDSSNQVLILTGGRHFCAGGDLEGLDAPALEMRRAMQAGQQLIRRIVVGRVPVVAAVEGNAYGAGFSLAMACDFVVADENTRFCAAFGRVGLTPDYGLLWTLPQRIGLAHTRELVMLCEPISGSTAHAWGAVDRLCEPGKVLETAIQLATRLATQSPGTIATAKSVLARFPLQLDALLAWEADTQALLMQSEDFTEGLRAFAEKRAPVFKGR